MYAFNAALHQSISLGKRRLIVLMNADLQSALLGTTSEDDIVSLRLYLRQHTCIDYLAADYLGRLLYALPVHGMLPHNQHGPGATDTDDVPLVVA